ncbi:MAG: GNAT family N-acetyltransferase [Magnetococcus sp. DMHC-8]
MSACVVQPLTPPWQAEAQRVYDRAFAGAALPYGHRLPDGFLASRVFGSSLWPADCSQLLVTRTGEGVGLLLANRRANPAVPSSDWLWLHLLCIVPARRRQGWGRHLLAGLRERAHAEGRCGVATALQWAGLWPGVPEGLTAMRAFGDRTGAEWRPGELYLVKHLAEPWPESGLIRLVAAGEEIMPIPYARRHRDSLQKLLHAEFGTGWQHETLSRIDAGYEPFNGYGLATTGAPDHAGRGVWVLEQGGQVIGFCVVQWEGEGSTAFFGPIGLSPAWRGRGLGTRLLLAAARQARATGRERLGLWTSAALAEGFYQPLGFQALLSTRHALWQ